MHSCQFGSWFITRAWPNRINCENKQILVCTWVEHGWWGGGRQECDGAHLRCPTMCGGFRWCRSQYFVTFHAFLPTLCDLVAMLIGPFHLLTPLQKSPFLSYFLSSLYLFNFIYSNIDNLSFSSFNPLWIHIYIYTCIYILLWWWWWLNGLVCAQSDHSINLLFISSELVCVVCACTCYYWFDQLQQIMFDHTTLKSP